MTASIFLRVWDCLGSISDPDLTLVTGFSVENCPLHSQFPFLLCIGFCSRMCLIFKYLRYCCSVSLLISDFINLDIVSVPSGYSCYRLVFLEDKLKAIPLKSGTIQGCPIFPYLGNTVLEVLARAIISQKKVKGIQIGK